MSGDRSLGVGDLPIAGAVSSTDTSPLCQSPTGCFAADSSVSLKGVSQLQLATYYQSTFGVQPPLAYNGVGTFSLQIDPTTLAVVSGALTVIGGGGSDIEVPVAPLLSGNGQILGAVAPGQYLNLGGAFPAQTLTVTGLLPLTGGTVTGEIISAVNPANADSLTTNRIVTQQVGTIANSLLNYLPLAGGTMTGDLIIGYPMTNPLAAVNKAYVDAQSGGGGIDIPNAPLLSGNGSVLGAVSLGSYLSLAGGFPGQTLNVGGLLPLVGGTMTGNITFAAAASGLIFSGLNQGLQFSSGSSMYEDASGGPVALRLRTANLPATLEASTNPAGTRSPIMTQTSSDARYLQLTGGILSGTLSLLIPPVNPTDAATKAYVDANSGGGPPGGFLPITGGTMTGPITMTGSGSAITTIYGGGLAGKALAIGDQYCGFDRSSGSTPAAALYLYMANSSNVTTPVQTWDLQGNLSNLAVNLSMTSHAITNLLNPVNPQDAVTKAYVDGPTPGTGGPFIPLSGNTSPMTGNLLLRNGGGLTNAALAFNDPSTGFYRTGSTLVMTIGGALNSQYTATSAQFGVNVNMSSLYQINNLANPAAAGDALSLGYADGRYVAGGPFALSYGDPGILYGSATRTASASSVWAINSVSSAGQDIVGTFASITQSFSPSVIMFRARGSTGSEAAVQLNDILGNIQSGGYGASQWGPASGDISFIANENFSNTNSGTRIRFRTTPNTQNAPVIQALIGPGLSVGAPTAPVVAMTTGDLNAAGRIMVNGANPGGGYSISWIAGMNPNGAVIMIAQRAMTITAVYGWIRTAGATSTIGVTNSTGGQIHQTALAAQTAGFLNMGMTTTTLAVNDCLVLQAVGGAWATNTSVGNITVYVA